MFRLFQIVVLLVALVTAAWLVLTVPDLGQVVLDKVAEGGMWTALAIFIVAAVALGYSRRGADPGDGRPR